MMANGGTKEEECRQKSRVRTRPCTDLRAIVNALGSKEIQAAMTPELQQEAIDFYEEHIRRQDELDRECTAIANDLLEKIRGDD